MSNNSPIGVFDSGVGGLTVVREITRQLPNESIIYFGDTARVPYGNKSKETVTTYSRQIVNFLIKNNVKAIVIACNTASAFALETIKNEIDIPIIGVVKPGAKTAYLTTKNKRIGVIGTVGTAHSKIYNQYIEAYDKNIFVDNEPCPLFVPLVEEGMIEDEITDEMIRRYTKRLLSENIDTLVLGCTHYPLLRDEIRKVLGNDINLVNPAYETAIALKEILTNNNLLTTSNIEASHRFYVSDGAEQFKAFANKILTCHVEEIRDINNIESYN